MGWNLANAGVFVGLAIAFLLLGILISVVGPRGKRSGAGGRTSASAVSAGKPAPVIQAGISGETVAVIAAAVAAMMEEQAPGTEYVLTGIRRAEFSRPVWGFAGMQQNTRPF